VIKVKTKKTVDVGECRSSSFSVRGCGKREPWKDWDHVKRGGREKAG